MIIPYRHFYPVDAVKALKWTGGAENPSPPTDPWSFSSNGVNLKKGWIK
jgi:hypothetical protein